MTEEYGSPQPDIRDPFYDGPGEFESEDEQALPAPEVAAIFPTAEDRAFDEQARPDEDVPIPGNSHIENLGHDLLAPEVRPEVSPGQDPASIAEGRRAEAANLAATFQHNSVAEFLAGAREIEAYLAGEASAPADSPDAR